MVLKMDNTDASAPQAGLGNADLVVEELVEGGMTRLAVILLLRHPARRPGALDAGQRHRHRLAGRRRDGHQRRGRGDDRPDQGRRHPVLQRGSPRASTGTTPAARRTTCSPTCPRSPSTSSRTTRPARTTTCRGATRTTSRRASRRDRSRRRSPAGTRRTGPSRTAATSTRTATPRDGDEFPADTVLVLRVKVGDAGYSDPAGNPVPETKFDRQRQALIFHGGRLVRGTWRRTALDDAVSCRPRPAS